MKLTILKEYVLPGLAAGVGKGFLRTIQCNSELIGDFIPVDLSINLIIAAAWGTSLNEKYPTNLFSCCARYYPCSLIVFINFIAV